MSLTPDDSRISTRRPRHELTAGLKERLKEDLMTVLIGTTPGVYRDERGRLWLDLDELAARLGLGDTLIARVRLRAAVLVAARQAGRPIDTIERPQMVSRETEKVPA